MGLAAESSTPRESQADFPPPGPPLPVMSILTFSFGRSNPHSQMMCELYRVPLLAGGRGRVPVYANRTPQVFQLFPCGIFWSFLLYAKHTHVHRDECAHTHAHMNTRTQPPTHRVCSPTLSPHHEYSGWPGWTLRLLTVQGPERPSRVCLNKFWKQPSTSL